MQTTDTISKTFIKIQSKGIKSPWMIAHVAAELYTASEENGNLMADKTKFLISLLNIPQESSFKTKEKLFSDTENLYGWIKETRAGKCRTCLTCASSCKFSPFLPESVAMDTEKGKSRNLSIE